MKKIFANSTSPLRTIPHNSNILQHFKTDSFFISIFVLKNNYIVVLPQQSVDWMFDFSFSIGVGNIHLQTYTLK